MNRRSFLAASAASAATCLATPAAAQALNFDAAAAYSAERRGVALLAMRRGEVIFADYPNEGGAARGWELASGTKSFTGVMCAAAIQDGLISSWEERAAETLTEWRNDDRRRITIRHILSLTSGIAGGPIARPPTYADAVAQQPEAAPGERFAYGPTPFQIFGEIMRRKTGGDALDYLTRRIFAPLGIEPTHWRRGADGMPHMPSGAGLTAHDWSRFGWFVLQGGEGRVDANALRECFTPSRANPGYGLSFWLLRSGLIAPGRNAGIEIDASLSERFGNISMAAGAGNQRLYLIPALDLVIARQASGIMQALMRRQRGPQWSDAEFLRLALGSLRDQ